MNKQLVVAYTGTALAIFIMLVFGKILQDPLDLFFLLGIVILIQLIFFFIADKYTLEQLNEGEGQ